MARYGCARADLVAFSTDCYYDTILSTTPPRATAVVLISGGYSSSTDFELPNSVVLFSGSTALAVPLDVATPQPSL